MPNRAKNRREAQRAYDQEWAVQPRWVKLLTVAVALPAWIVLLVKTFTEEVSDRAATISSIAFGMVVLIQIFCGIRAQRRGEMMEQKPMEHNPE